MPGQGATRRAREARAIALLLPSIVFWLFLAAIATVAGVARELALVPLLGDLRGHQVGTVLVTAAFMFAISLFVARMRLAPGEALTIGVGWLLCAIVFEFGFGRYVDGRSWSRLLSDYDLTEGRLLILLWLAVGIGPFLIARWDRRPTAPHSRSTLDRGRTFQCGSESDRG